MARSSACPPKSSLLVASFTMGRERSVRRIEGYGRKSESGAENYAPRLHSPPSASSAARPLFWMAPNAPAPGARGSCGRPTRSTSRSINRLVARKPSESLAVERSAETIKAAYDSLDMPITSHRLAHGTIASAIYLAFRGADYADVAHPTSAPINLTKAVELIRDELLFLDKSGCPSRVFYSGILAMAIIALAVDPDAKAFIKQIADKRGNKIDGKMDPAESVLHLALITELMEPGRVSSYQAELFSRALRGFDKWRNAKRKPARAHTKGVLTKIEPGPFVQEFRVCKRIQDRIDL